MKTTSTRISRRRHELLREFFACAVVIAAIKSGHPYGADSKSGHPGSPPSGHL